MNAVGQQVAGILAVNDINFSGPDEDDTLFVRIDSAVLQIDTEAGRTPSVELRAWLLTDLDLDAAAEEAILERLNEMNAEWLFPKFVLYPHLGAITIEYDVFAYGINEDDFMRALGQIGGMADDFDDELQREFGGRRAVDLADPELQAALAELEAVGGNDDTSAAPSGWRKFMPGSGG